MPYRSTSRNSALHPTLGSLLAVLSACTAVGPDYRPPPTVPPDHWSETTRGSQPASRLAAWWRGFGDPRLNWLVDRALEENLDLQVAAARVSAARAEQLSADAAFWPRLNASGGYQRLRLSPNAIKGLFGAFETGEEGGSQASSLFSRLGPVGRPFDLFQAGFDASWELDLFGGIQRRHEAVDAAQSATVEAGRALMVRLTAEVARTYLELLALERRRRIALDRVENQREILRLAQHAYTEGLTTALDVQRAGTELEDALALPPAFETRIKHARHALATLLGLPAAGLDHRLREPLDDLPEPPVIPAGLPSEVLRRRPDIRRAEREAAAASARIGVAAAELFPKLSLTGSVGLQSQELSNFTSLSSGFYGFGPRLSLPIFQAGRLQANVELQQAEFDQAVKSYQKTVLTAFQEVEDALASVHGESRRKAALTSAEASARHTAAISRIFYLEGETDFQAVLEAQRAWHRSRDQLAEARLAWATAHVALYKALGGGWSGASATAAPARPGALPRTAR